MLSVYERAENPMYAITSLLDEKHNLLIEEMWQEFKTRFNVHGVHQTPIAHFTYHVAREYDMPQLDEVLTLVAGETQSFTVRTGGLGIFTGADPVLYIPVNPNPALDALHARLWEVVPALATEPGPLYRAANWRPHITLTHHDVDHDLLPKVVRLLTERDFYWQINVDNLAVIGGESDINTLKLRFPFATSSPIEGDAAL